MKNKIKKSHLMLAIIAVVGLLCSLSSCKKSTTETPKTVPTFSSIKNTNWRGRLNDTFEVEGYYDEVNGIGKLYSVAEDQLTDGPTPEERYLWIAKPSALTYVPDYSNFIGRKVKIKGTLFAAAEGSLVTTSRVFGDPSLAGLKVVSIITGNDSTKQFQRPVAFDFCDRYPAICQIIANPSQAKVALLYSGGINAGNAHQRYWNDIYVMYKILKNQYGFSDANIVVCYKAGVANDHASEVPVDFAATPSGFDSAINLVKSKMSTSSKFFCFINNHGGGYETSTGLNYGISPDANADEVRAGVSDHNTDEQIYFYNSSSSFSDDLLASKINTLTFGTGIFLLKPCFSGGLIWDLRGANRVLISAGTEFEVTHGHSSGNFGDLTFHFLGAISGQKPDGSASVNADFNGDGKVSMKEVFDYIRANHTSIDHPQYSDDGTGNSFSTSPSSSSFGAGVFL